MGVQFLRVGIGGDNAFRLDVTEDEWTRYGLRQQLARYAQFLTSALRDAQVQPAGGTAAEFTFTLGRGATLKFPLTETLDVRVDGKPIGGFRHPPVSAAVAQCADAEVPSGTWVERADLVTCGVGTFEDEARLACHRARVAAHASNPLGGRVDAVIEPANPRAGLARGIVFWRYAVPQTAARTLAAHETVTERFELTDQNRSDLRVGLAVTVTGTTGVPIIAGEMEEGLGVAGSDASHSVSGTVRFDELVRAGMQGALLVPDAGNRLEGRLELVAHERGESQAGDVRPDVFWNYRAPWSTLRRLAPGELSLERFLVSYVNPACGKPVRRQVTVSVTGAEGAPVIALASSEPCQTPGEVACGVTRRATAVVELTRALWLSQTGVMLEGTQAQAPQGRGAARAAAGAQADRIGPARGRKAR